MKSKIMAIMAVAAIAAVLFGSVAYAVDEFPPYPLSVKGYVFNEDGSPVARGTSVSVMNGANGQLEQTLTGTGYPLLPQYDNAFTASLAYDPTADQKIIVAARSGDYYAEESLAASSSHIKGNLTLKYSPQQTETEAKMIGIGGRPALPKPTENGTANAVPTGTEPIKQAAPQSNIILEIISYSLIGVAFVLIVTAMVFASMKARGNKGHGRAAYKALAILAVSALVLMVPAQMWMSMPASVSSSVAFISGIVQPTALQVQPEAGIFGPPQPVSVSGYVFHSNGTFVGNCTSVNVTIRAPNGTITNLEQTCTGKGFPPAVQFYPRYTSSVTGTLNSDTTNVTAWNATHQGRNSSLLTSDTILLNITLTEWLPESVQPKFYDNQSQVVSSYNPAGYSNFSVNWTDNTEMRYGYIEANFTGSLQNLTMSNTTGGGSVIYTYNTTPLPAGTYRYRLVGVDTFNNSNATDIFYFTILQANNPVHLYLNGTLDANVTITYPAVSNATGTATAGTALLWRDEVSKGNPEIAQLAVATYAYKVNTSGNQNYSANNTGLTYYLINNRAASSISVSRVPSASETYGTQTNATCSITTGDASATLTLQRNGTTVPNPEATVLGAGAWNYTCVYSQSQNYSASSSLNNYLSIARASPSSSLALELQNSQADTSVIYGTSTNATGYATLANNQDLTFALYRNGTSVASGDPASNVLTLGAGAYAYVYNTTGGANYTSGTSATRTLLVNKTSFTLQFYIDGSQSNRAVNYNSTVNMSVASSPTAKPIEIRTNYSSGTNNLWHSGTTPTEKISNYTVNGTWNFTAVFAGDANYTAASVTYYLTVYPTDLEKPQWSNQSQGSAAPTAGSSNSLLAYWTDNIQLGYAWLSTNESGIWRNYTATAISGIGNWSTFSWSNSSLGAGALVMWKIFANDSAGNTNVTDEMNFTIAAAAVQPPGAGAPPAPSLGGLGGGAPTFDVRMSKSSYSKGDSADLIFNVSNPGNAIDIYADVSVTRAGVAYKSFRVTKTVDTTLEWISNIEAIECSTPYGPYDVSVKWYYVTNDRYIKQDTLSYSVSTCKGASIIKLATDKSTYALNATMKIATDSKNTGNQNIGTVKLELSICNKKSECDKNKLTKIKDFTFDLPVGITKPNNYDYNLKGLKEGQYELRASLTEGKNVLDSKKMNFTISIPAAPAVDYTGIGVATGGVALVLAAYLRRKALLIAPKIIVIIRNNTQVTTTLINRSRVRKFKNVIVEDMIPGKPKVENITPTPSRVIRSNIYTKIVWKLNIGAKGKIKMGYKIGAKFKRLPKAKIKSFERVPEPKNHPAQKHAAKHVPAKHAAPKHVPAKRAAPKKHTAPKQAAPKKPIMKKTAPKKKAGK